MPSFVDRLDQLVAEKHLLKHPFYLAWTRGELSMDALRDYARQYYRHVDAFPTYLSATHSGCEDQEVRKELLANLNDEEAGSPNHPDLWLRFAGGLGVSGEEVRGTAAWEETTRLVSTFRDVCRNGSTAEGLAALYAYESQIPEICVSKIEGLRDRYGFRDPETYRYFTVHIEADREHAAAERRMIESQTGKGQEASAEASASRALDALWEMLNGVCRRHGIAC